MAGLPSRANHSRLNDEISPFRNPDDAANDETNGMTSLIERAETLKNKLQNALSETRELISALNRQKKQSRLVQSTLASLRQLQTLDA